MQFAQVQLVVIKGVGSTAQILGAQQALMTLQKTCLGNFSVVAALYRESI